MIGSLHNIIFIHRRYPASGFGECPASHRGLVKHLQHESKLSRGTGRVEMVPSYCGLFG